MDIDVLKNDWWAHELYHFDFSTNFDAQGLSAQGFTWADGFKFQWFANIDTGTGTVTASCINTSMPSGKYTFQFGDLELVSSAASGNTASATWGDTDGSPAYFRLSRNGRVVGESQIVTFGGSINTDPNARAHYQKVTVT